MARTATGTTTAMATVPPVDNPLLLFTETAVVVLLLVAEDDVMGDAEVVGVEVVRGVVGTKVLVDV